eukprot:TRINITY_DN69957_c0_g2_i1.p1 TRINITY_DN69957_c0_g2~~TRINITY_DN69957_c0_g2_i1.p1  ORF type:complete len:472 (-),score=78.62 TRINITY_DN69957_c0_g2_i1:184-1578(-)
MVLRLLLLQQLSVLLGVDAERLDSNPWSLACPPADCDLNNPQTLQQSRSLWFLHEALSKVSAVASDRSLLTLRAFRRTVCVYRFSGCYERAAYVAAVQEVCLKIQEALELVGLATIEAGEWALAACQRPVKILAALDFLKEQGELSAPSSEDEASSAGLLYGAEDAAGSVVLKALLGDPALPAGSSALSQSGRLTKWVVNLGAGPNSHDVEHCQEDIGNCLVFGGGWRGVLFEGDARRLELLRRTSLGQDGVFVASGFVSPEDCPSRVRDVVFALDKAAYVNAMQLGDELFPDFLKIDVDNGDCDFLELALSAFKPLFVEIEILHGFLPPSIKYRQRYNGGMVNHSMLYAVPTEDLFSRGCSLGMAAALLPDYVLVQLTCPVMNAYFAHRDIVKAAGLSALDVHAEWEACMGKWWERLLLTRLGYSMYSFDLEAFRGQSTAVQLDTLRQHFTRYGSHEDWELTA